VSIYCGAFFAPLGRIRRLWQDDFEGAILVIQTTRFGAVQLQSEDIIDFPEGILGFNDLRKFVLLDDPNDEIFAWLQSCEVPQIAFPVLEPELFTSNYAVMLTKHDLESLGLQKQEKTRAFSIITIPDDATQMTANSSIVDQVSSL
jgi:flagellar assembly factor FliW